MGRGRGRLQTGGQVGGTCCRWMREGRRVAKDRSDKVGELRGGNMEGGIRTRCSRTGANVAHLLEAVVACRAQWALHHRHRRSHANTSATRPSSVESTLLLESRFAAHCHPPDSFQRALALLTKSSSLHLLYPSSAPCCLALRSLVLRDRNEAIKLKMLNTAIARVTPTHPHAHSHPPPPPPLSFAFLAHPFAPDVVVRRTPIASQATGRLRFVRLSGRRSAGARAAQNSGGCRAHVPVPGQSAQHAPSAVPTCRTTPAPRARDDAVSTHLPIESVLPSLRHPHGRPIAHTVRPDWGRTVRAAHDAT